MQSHPRTLALAALAAAALTWAGMASAQTAFELTVLEPLPGEATTRVWAPGSLNAQGRAVGTSGEFPDRRAAMWSRLGVAQPLAPGAGNWSRAVAINNRGQAVGAVDTNPDPGVDFDEVRAVRWNRPDQPPEFFLSDNGAYSDAAAINERGWIVGLRYVGPSANGYWQAFIWAPDGTEFYLDPPSADEIIELVDIDDQNRAVGFTFDEVTEVGRPLTWTPSGGIQYLAEAGGAFGVSQAGRFVAGENALGEAVLWRRDGAVVPLPNFSGSVYSSVFFVNDRGQAGGVSVVEDPDTGDFHDVWTLWRHDGPVDVNELLIGAESYTVVDLWANNNQGQVLGLAVDADDNLFAVLLDPRQY